jgi:hypothetical protein
MESNVRARFWLESALASLCGLLAVVTLVRRDWIEALTGLDPDHHGGAFEWAIVAGLLVLFVVTARVARAEWRRPRTAAIPAR